MDFDYDETMRRHDATLNHYKEKVEMDQRAAGLLPAGGSLPDYTGKGFSQTQSQHISEDFSGVMGAGARHPSMADADDLLGFGTGNAYPSNQGTAVPSKPSIAHTGSSSTTPAKKATKTASVMSTAQGRGARTGPSSSAPEAGATPGRTPGRATPRTSHPLRVYDRVSQWHRRRQQKLEEERKKHAAKEIEGCPFAPVTRSELPPSFDHKSGSIYGGNGRAWGYDEFVERQREARRRMNEKNESGKYTGKGWKNETTVCQEFQLGRRDKSIKALQKPLSPPTFVPSVSEHHHLAKEMTALSTDSPLAQLAAAGLPQRGLFSERISTAIIDNTMLHPTDAPSRSHADPAGSMTASLRADSVPQGEWARRSAEKQSLESQLHAHTTRPWRGDGLSSLGPGP